jgi:hypothetical protein
MRREVVVVGVALGVVGCAGGTAPTPSHDPPGIVEPPPAPPAPAVLPTWDAVVHPNTGIERTNPPAPELWVTRDGAHCFVHWRQTMRMTEPGEVTGDRIVDCSGDCGTEIVCPPQAQELLDAAKPG